MIRTAQGDLKRTRERLVLSNITATAEGLSAKADLAILAPSGKPGTFQADGQIDLVNLETFRRQLPEATFWKWIDPASPASRGRITFAAHGLTAKPALAQGTGGFRFQEFAASIPTGSDRERWHVPVRELTGRLRLNENRLALSSIQLRSDLVKGTGNLVLANLTGGASTSGFFRLASDRWQELPILKGRVPPAIRGGALVTEFHASGLGAPGQPQPPITGTATLQGATYQGTLAGRTRTVALESSRADFRWAAGRVAIPSYRLVTPLFRTTGAGYARQTADGASPQWLYHGEGTLVTGDAGALLAWWSGQKALQDGDLTARYALDVPSAAPERFTLASRIRLTDSRPVLPRESLPFPAAETSIRSLTGNVTIRDGFLRFTDAVWQAPHFRIEGDGTVRGETLDGNFSLATREWQFFGGELARALPVSGGELLLSGRLRGPVSTLSSAPVEGTAALRGVRLTQGKTGFPVQGGTLELAVGVRGTLDRLTAVALNGTFAVRDLKLPPWRPGLQPLVVETAHGRFRRSGPNVTLTEVVARAKGARLDGGGELRGLGTAAATHAFRLNVAGPSLARLIPSVAPVPGKVEGGRFTGSVNVSGNSRVPFARADGRAEVLDGDWTPPGQATAMKIEHLRARFDRAGGTAHLRDGLLRTPGGAIDLTGTVTGLDTAAGAKHLLSATWRFEDASAWATRFLPVPGWFTGGLLTGSATVAGTAAQPAQTAAGVFEVRDAGFMPPARFLGGPVKPVGVRWAKGRFHRAGGKTALSQLDLNTTIGTAAGRVVADDRGMATIRMTGLIQRLEPLVDLWPSFKDRIVGGRAELTIALQGPLRRPRALEGTIDILGKDGVLTAENVDPLYAAHPFEQFDTHLVLSRDGSVKIAGVKMRGPKASFDAEGLVTADGKVSGKGKAWFSSRYTKKLVKPSIAYPLAVLAGYERVKTAFEVKGTLREARLDLGITDSLAWKLAIKNKVPEGMRKLATGEAPLWSVDGPGPAGTVTARSKAKGKLVVRQ